METLQGILLPHSVQLWGIVLMQCAISVLICLLLCLKHVSDTTTAVLTQDLSAASQLHRALLSPAVSLLCLSPVWGALCGIRTLCGFLVCSMRVLSQNIWPHYRMPSKIIFSFKKTTCSFFANQIDSSRWAQWRIKCSQDFFKIMQFLGNFKGETLILSKFWAQGPWGQNSAGPPWPKSWIHAWG